MNNPSYTDDSERNPAPAEMQLQPAAEYVEPANEPQQSAEEDNSGFVLGYN